MDRVAHEAEAAVEATHWWFTGRRALFAQLIRKLGLPASARVLDVGTSTGTNLRMLRDLAFQDVTGLDQSAEAARFCAEKGLGHVQLGDVCALPFDDGSFDLVLATDVIEHVDDDAKALTELCRVLKPSGHLLLTVPTFESLWGLQDEVGQHKRRYVMQDLLARMRAGGFRPVQRFYFNFILFLPILAARKLMRVTRPPVENESELNPGWLNIILTQVFRLDVALAPVLQPPFGVSALVLAVPEA
jgi:SAM-dependent methyltransferase